MNPTEAMQRIIAGEIPEQQFFHREKANGYRWANKYRFSDGAVLTAFVVSQLLSQRKVVLVVDGDIRKVVLVVDGDRRKVEPCKPESS